MKEEMPKRGFNLDHPEVQRFFPNPKFGVDCYNRADLRALKKKARNYRGNTSRAQGK